jgi:hypothetical protein
MEWRSLRDALNEWTDWDVAGYALAVSLGLMAARQDWGGEKHVFWSNHPIGNMLYGMLDELVTHGVLETRDEPDRQYRWNRGFRGDWPVPV